MTDPTTLSAAELDALYADLRDGFLIPKANLVQIFAQARRAEAAERKVDRLRALLDDERYGDEVIGKVTIRRALAED